jgi:hypothetical protein
MRPDSPAQKKVRFLWSVYHLPARSHLDDLIYTFDCVHLERFHLGTPYPEIELRVSKLLAHPRLQPRRPRPAIDGTEVGRAVVDLFLNRCLTDEASPATITAGDTVRHDAWNNSQMGCWVPKRELVGSIQSGLQSGRLKFASRLPLAGTLKKELLNFQVKITTAANETFGAWRENTHDDLVLALAIAMWLGERREIDFLPADSKTNDRDSMVLAAEVTADTLALERRRRLWNKSGRFRSIDFGSSGGGSIHSTGGSDGHIRVSQAMTDFVSARVDPQRHRARSDLLTLIPSTDS